MVLVALLVSACTPSSEDTTTSSSTTTQPTTTTTTRPTTTTLDPAVVDAATCDALKVAIFDLDAAVTAGLEPLGVEDGGDLSDAVVGQVVVESLIDFYDRIGQIADDAPPAIAQELGTLAASLDAWRGLVNDDSSEELLEALDPAALVTPDVAEAADAIATWTLDRCGAEIATDPEAVMFTTVFATMFGALGGLFGDLGDVFGTDPPIEPNATALAYGDDPVLDDLYERCGTGDGQACRDLYFSAYGEYELWGQTCGASIPLRPAFVVDCTTKFAGSATAYGDDFVLDTLWDQCAATDPDSCDALFAAAPFGSEYEHFGASCADTRDGDFSRPCTFASSAEPFGYGDDLGLDQLWEACAAGDRVACDDLFFQTPIESAYEAFGRVCGDLTAVAYPCENAAAWLGGPVG